MANNNSQEKNPFWGIVGQRINTLIAESNSSQKELAEHLGLKPNIISYWCSGARRPDIEQIAKIAKYFDVTSDYLLGLSDISSTDGDTITFCKETGLNETAALALFGLISTKALNVLLASPCFDELLSILCDIEFISSEWLKEALDGDIIYKVNIDLIDTNRYRAIKLFDCILDSFDQRKQDPRAAEIITEHKKREKENPRPNDEHSDGE